MTTTSAKQSDTMQDMLCSLSGNWWLFVLRGVLALVIAVLAFLMPAESLLALTLVFGAFAFADGVFGLVAAVRFVTGEQAEALLGRGEMDLVAVGKAALANNDWPQRIQQGIELSDFDGSMFVPMATITNELAWRNANDRPALRSS